MAKAKRSRGAEEEGLEVLLPGAEAAASAADAQAPAPQAPAPQAPAVQPPGAPSAEGPVLIRVTPDGVVTISVTPRGPGAAGAPGVEEAGLEAFSPRGVVDWLRGERPPEEDAGEPGPVQEALEKLRGALKTIGEKVGAFAEDVAVLEVRTFVSDRLNALEDDFFTTEEPRALTRVKLDGDTDVVAPLSEGRLDEALWRIHSDTVAQAQAHREAMLRTVLELVRGIVPSIK